MTVSRRSLLMSAFIVFTICLGLSWLGSSPVHAVTIDMVTVGNPGNAADYTHYGAVADSYQIGTYNVTIGQYTEFLNAVAKTDTYALYNTEMGDDLNIAGISRSGSSGAFTYSVMNNGGDSSNRPITYVSWFDAARFANWMANGQPTGAQTNTTTENGAYNLNGATSGDAVAKNATNPNTSTAPTFFIPTENQWYKAAYYSPNYGGTGSAGYFAYATQSDEAPGNMVGSGVNQANYFKDVFSVTQSPEYSETQNYLTDVGAFTNSASFYGTFDQSGNVWQWNDLDGTAGSVDRGGDWGMDTYRASDLSSFARAEDDPSTELPIIGFRLASPVAVPEPSTWVMGLAGIACAGWHVGRRRQARQPSPFGLCPLAEIHFRNIRILELPPGITLPEQTAPLVP